MNRQAITDLYNWKAKANRKPLILQGARQVGKTWLMKRFAAEAFENYVYVNFEDNRLLEHLFEKDFDMNRILMEIQLATGQTVTSGSVLLLDEIQEVKRGVTSLKYFYEQLPDLAVIAAGSLLGIAMHHDDSFPVGKVDFMTLYPLSFLEFLSAVGDAPMAQLLNTCNWPVINTFAPKIEARLRQYYLVGGMPEVVDSFASQTDFNTVRQLQHAILDSYDRDFSKHASEKEVPRIRMVWKGVMGQLAKENRKFIYGFLKEGARAADFEIALEWLRDAGLVYKVHRTKKGLLPLSAYEDFSAFKVFLCDVGLLSAMADLPAAVLLDKSALFSDFKGALTEQFVLQQLKLSRLNDIYYWSNDRSQGEIDFLVQREGHILPIEVKAEENLRAKSLRTFVEANEGLHGIRFSMSPYREQSWLTNYPLFAVEPAINNLA